MRCSAVTKKKKSCPNEGDRARGDVWFCHVHDPEGLYRLQVQARRDDRKAKRSLEMPSQKRQRLAEPNLTPGWKMGKPVPEAGL